MSWTHLRREQTRLRPTARRRQPTKLISASGRRRASKHQACFAAANEAYDCTGRLSWRLNWQFEARTFSGFTVGIGKIALRLIVAINASWYGQLARSAHL